MLHHPTVDKLAELRLAGMRQGLLDQQAVPDIDRRHSRGLDLALTNRLAEGQWIRQRLNLLVTSPTGTGKTWIACALGNKACRDGFTVQYHRVSRLFDELGYAHGDGRYPKIIRKIART